MSKKKTTKRAVKKKRMSNTKLMFLSFILLFIVFEALYILKGQHEARQANSGERQVAGASVQK